MGTLMSSVAECEIIQKQQLYIKELEQKIDKMKEDCKHTFICSNCKYFIQHYYKDMTGRFSEVHCGHCIATNRVKSRKPNDKSCNVFESKYY